MPQEIEVKYLIKQPPPTLDALNSEKIKQGYLAANSDETVVRVRQKGDSYFLTVKGNGLLSRKEVEIELKREQFEELWPMTVGKRIEKTRYYIKHDPHLIELDVFEGKLQGLIVAEVEFGSEEDAKSFVPPEWFSEEVTWDSRYQNNKLALDGLPK